MIKKALEQVVTSLVAKPDLVSVKEVCEGTLCSYHIVVGEGDRGLIIGRDGQTIRALQMLAQALEQQGRTIEVMVVR